MKKNMGILAKASPWEQGVEDLKVKIRGRIMLPDDDGYDSSRSVWNAMIDKYPALVVKCAGASDIIEAVKFARQNELLVAVKSGGHSFAGRSVCEGGLLIDLSGMRGVRVDPIKMTARAEAGALLSDLDHETQAFGLAVTAGVVPIPGSQDSRWAEDKVI